MRSDLFDIAKEITAQTGIKCNVMPQFKIQQKPELIIMPRSLMKRWEGLARNNIRGTKSTINELHFNLVLRATGKSDHFVEEFYKADELCNQVFLKRLTIPMSTVNSQSNPYVDFEKQLNGGEYWETTEGTGQEESAYILSEVWECIYKFYGYKQE